MNTSIKVSYLSSLLSLSLQRVTAIINIIVTHHHHHHTLPRPSPLSVRKFWLDHNGVVIKFHFISTCEGHEPFARSTRPTLTGVNSWHPNSAEKNNAYNQQREMKLPLTRHKKTSPLPLQNAWIEVQMFSTVLSATSPPSRYVIRVNH